MNTNTKGRIAELIAITKYVSLGYIVLQPVNKDGVYDLVIEKGGVFKKIQVKTLLDQGDVYVLNVRSITHNRKKNIIKYYTSEEIDLFVGVDILTGSVLEIPFNESYKSSLYLRKVDTKNSQTKKVKWAKDFKI